MMPNHIKDSGACFIPTIDTHQPRSPIRDLRFFGKRLEWISKSSLGSISFPRAGAPAPRGVVRVNFFPIFSRIHLLFMRRPLERTVI